MSIRGERWRGRPRPGGSLHGACGTLVVVLVGSSLGYAAPAPRRAARAASAARAARSAPSPQPRDTIEDVPKAPAPPSPAQTVAEPVRVDSPPDVPHRAAPLAAPAFASAASAAPAAPAVHDDVEAAGRPERALAAREAARLAAGRIEVAVSASADLGSRHFTYSDPIGPQFAPYHLSVAPMASFGLEAYPLASSDLPVLRDIGFRGRVSRAFAVDSETPDGQPIATSWTRFGGELRVRALLAHHAEVGAFVGGDASYFSMSTRSEVPALLPAARTVSVRCGLDTQLRLFGRWSLLLSGAYLAPLTRGEIYDRVRAPRLAGFDGELGVAVALVAGVDVRVAGRYTRYVAWFRPQLGDAIAAGGALDQQWQLGWGVRYAH